MGIGFTVPITQRKEENISSVTIRIEMEYKYLLKKESTRSASFMNTVNGK